MSDNHRDDEPIREHRGEEPGRRAKKKGPSKKSAVRRPQGNRAAAAKERSRAVGDGERSTSASRQALLFALVALVVGIGIGWVAHSGHPSQATAEGPVAAPSGSAGADGPCQQWTAAICKDAGDTSEACEQSRVAAGLMPDDACQLAIAQVSTTLAKVKNARSVCGELVAKLCADIGQETDSCKLVKEKTPNFPTEQCQQMMGNYDEVVAQLRTMEKQNGPISAETAAAQGAGNGPSFGPADAKVTVVEYSDFECPFCSRAATVVQQLKKKYADRVRFVFRQYPLPMHQNASLAAEASLAAHAQGKFWQLHDKMFQNQRALDRASLEKYAEEVGLNMVEFRAALDKHTHRPTVQADTKLGEEIGVNGTPTMLVNTKRVPNPTDFAALAVLIDGELAAVK